MKTPSRLVLALLAVASCAAGAQTVYSGQADQERRERNREEALSHYRDQGTSSSTDNMSMRHERAREKTHDVAQAARHDTHEAANTTRRVTHKSANAVRRVAHKTAVKARDITARADAKFGTRPTQPRMAGEGSTRTGEPPAPK